MLSVPFKLLIIWCLCYPYAIGHSGKNLRNLKKNISNLRRNLSKRIDKLETQIQAVHSGMEGNPENVRNSGDFSASLKREMLDSLKREMETMLAGRIAQGVLNKIAMEQASSEFKKLKKEMKNIWQGLQVQKTDFRHLRSEVTSLLNHNDRLHQNKPQRDNDVCFEANVLEMCLKENRSLAGSFIRKEKSVGMEVDTNENGGLNKKTEQIEKLKKFNPDSYTPNKLIFAGSGDGEQQVYELDLDTYERRLTKLTFKFLSSFAYHPGLRRLFYSLLVPGDTLGSVFLDNTSNIMYDVGNDMVTHLALDFKRNKLFYTTNYPWSVKVFDIETRSYSLVKNFPSHEQPIDIALDLDKVHVFVLIRYHTGNTAVVCFNSMGIQKHIIADLVTQIHGSPFSAIDFSSGMLIYSRKAVLTYRSMNHRSGRGGGVVELPGEADAISTWGDTCFIALRNNRGIVSVSLRDKDMMRVGSSGINGGRHLLSLV